MKTLLLASSFVLSFTGAMAGNLAYVAPQVAAIEEPTRMGGSGAWIIPLVVVAVLALTITKKSSDQMCAPTFTAAPDGGNNVNAIAVPC